jgi:hypothetical protein
MACMAGSAAVVDGYGGFFASDGPSSLASEAKYTTGYPFDRDNELPFGLEPTVGVPLICSTARRITETLGYSLTSK